MQKTLCFILGLLVGAPAGVGGVIWQLKYGKAPVVAAEMTALGEPAPSILEEPKPLEDSGDEYAEETPAAPEAPQSETYHRMMRALIDHARTGAPTPADPEPAVPDSHFAVEPLKPRSVEVPMDPVAEPAPPLAETPAPEKQRKHKTFAVPCTGSYPATLADGQLQLPAHVYDILGGRPRTLYLVPTEQYAWNDGCLTSDGDRLTVCDAAGLAKLVARERAERGEHSYLTLRWLSRVERVDVTVEGRLSVPAALLKETALDSNVVLLGNGDGYEIWNADRWSKEIKHDAVEECDPEPSDLSLEGLLEVLNKVLDHASNGLAFQVEIVDECPTPLQALLDYVDHEDDWELIAVPPQEEILNPQRIHGGIQ